MKAIAILAVCIAMAGCATPQPQSNTTGREHPIALSIAYLGTCPFHYPDGSSVECKDSSHVVQPASQLSGPGWVCVDSTRGGAVSVSTYYNPATDEYAARYHFANETSGYAVRENGDGGIVSWRGAAGPDVYVPLGAAGSQSTTDVLVRIYSSRLTHATPPATEHELWSSYKGIPYPIVEVDSANGTFYVQSVFEWHFGGAVEYTWLPANLTGTDFSIGYAAYEIASANLALTKVPSGLPSTAVACGT